MVMHPPRQDLLIMSDHHRRERSRDTAKPRDDSSDTTVTSRPPRPPCWQDFARQGKSLSVTDLHVAKDSCSNQGSGPTSGSSCAGGSISGSRRRHQTQRRKNKLHRTRSEMCINHCGLTEEDYTHSLAEMNPRQLGLQRRSDFDNRLYFDESMQRCQRWLADLEASEPLEELAGVIHPRDSSSDSDVELEIPDESVSDYERNRSDSCLGYHTITEEVEGDTDDATITCDSTFSHKLLLPSNSQSSRPLHKRQLTKGRTSSGLSKHHTKEHLHDSQVTANHRKSCKADKT